MRYNVYRIVGGERPYLDFAGAFDFENAALAFCESETCQQSQAIRDKTLGQSFVCIGDNADVMFHKHFKWDGLD